MAAEGLGVPLRAGQPMAQVPWERRAGRAQRVKPSLTGGALWSFPTGARRVQLPRGRRGRHRLPRLGRPDLLRPRPDGTQKWSLLTGEIIDSAGLLDDRGRVYFGSGDGKLRALDAEHGRAVVDDGRRPPRRPTRRSSTGSRATSPSARAARSTCPTTTSSSTPSIATRARPVALQDARPDMVAARRRRRRRHALRRQQQPAPPPGQEHLRDRPRRAVWDTARSAPSRRARC